MRISLWCGHAYTDAGRFKQAKHPLLISIATKSVGIDFYVWFAERKPKGFSAAFAIAANIPPHPAHPPGAALRLVLWLRWSVWVAEEIRVSWAH